MMPPAPTVRRAQLRAGSRDAWGRRLAPFEKVEMARVSYLTAAEAERLINACEPDFRSLVRAGLETGCRYGELVKLEVCGFNPDAMHAGDPAEQERQATARGADGGGATFFSRHCAGRHGHELMFRHGDGGAWRTSEQARPMAELHQRRDQACDQLPYPPPHVGFARSDERRAVDGGGKELVEKHYGHLAPSFIADAIKAGAPRYRVKDDKRAVPLR